MPVALSSVGEVAPVLARGEGFTLSPPVISRPRDLSLLTGLGLTDSHSLARLDLTADF